MINLDIDAAIRAHRAWRTRFEQAIIGIDADKLDDPSITDCTKCVLGAWLNAEEQRKLDSLAAFRAVHDVHIEFHDIASRIVDQLHEAHVDEAHQILETAFVDVSDRLVDALEVLKRQ
jgi:hypothetical protein